MSHAVPYPPIEHPRAQPRPVAASTRVRSHGGGAKDGVAQGPIYRSTGRRGLGGVESQNVARALRSYLR
jgi:hypothetical protein